jgi:hypothetical protein
MCNQQSTGLQPKNERLQLDAQGATNWHYMLQATNKECCNQQALQVATKTVTLVCDERSRCNQLALHVAINKNRIMQNVTKKSRMTKNPSRLSLSGGTAV